MTEKVHMRKRTLSLKLEPNSPTWKRLRDLAWQQMRYKNLFLRARWAEAIGLRVDPEKGDPHDLTKHIRGEEKGELSGSAYSAAEREVASAWTRDGRRILAGAPLSEYRQNDSLCIRGHKRKNESGVRVELDGGRFVADLQVQAHACDGGSWIRVPVAKGTEIDDWQADLLRSMISWEVPITKGVVVFVPTKGRTYLRLSYELPVPLPVMGERRATLGPVNAGRMFLRTETQSIDYSHKITIMGERKTHWDGIRRRWCRQIGRRKGSARSKRRKLSQISLNDWMATFMHQWSDEVVAWLETQGVGTLTIMPLGTGDWPAHRFASMLAYKGEDAGIEVVESTEAILDEATKRAVKREVDRERASARKATEAIRTLRHAV